MKEKTKTLIEKIYDEIQSHGFPLEMNIANYLSNRGYFINQSMYYLDHEEDKSREIDIVAFKTLSYQYGKTKLVDEIRVTNNYFIECKSSSNKPWVILTSNYAESPITFIDVLSKNLTEYYLRLIGDKTLMKDHPYNFELNKGKSYFEAFKNGTGESIYKALNQSVKSAMYYIDKYKTLKNAYSFYYPIVVFQGDLFEAVINGEKIEVTSKDFVLLSHEHITGQASSRRLVIPIVKEEALDKFFDAFEASQEMFFDIIMRNKGFSKK